MKHTLFTRIVALSLCLLLVWQQAGIAQVAGSLDLSLHLRTLHSAFTQEKFRPLHLRSLSYDAQANNFKLLLDKGEGSKPISMEEETKQLLNYFFIGVSLPNQDFWVNLRPDSPDHIIDPLVEKTDIGRVFLETDLQLKKDTAAATSPQTPQGREYWDRLYAKAQELFGYESVTIPTLTRPWIVPGEIIIRETSDNAYIYKATLKVMLEEDYLKAEDSSATPLMQYQFKDPRSKALNQYSSQLIRQLIIPALTRQVNTSKRYAALRQVYYSLILAQWFKERYRGREGLYSRLINQQDLTNLTSKTPWSKDTYFKGYQESFTNGEYNLKEPQATPFGQTIRSYFSGGIMLGPDLATGHDPMFKAMQQGARVEATGDQPRTAKGLMAGVFDAGTVKLAQQETPVPSPGDTAGHTDTHYAAVLPAVTMSSDTFWNSCGQLLQHYGPAMAAIGVTAGFAAWLVIKIKRMRAVESAWENLLGKDYWRQIKGMPGARGALMAAMQAGPGGQTLFEFLESFDRDFIFYAAKHDPFSFAHLLERAASSVEFTAHLAELNKEASPYRFDRDGYVIYNQIMNIDGAQLRALLFPLGQQQGAQGMFSGLNAYQRVIMAARYLIGRVSALRRQREQARQFRKNTPGAAVARLATVRTLQAELLGVFAQGERDYREAQARQERQGRQPRAASAIDFYMDTMRFSVKNIESYNIDAAAPRRKMQELHEQLARLDLAQVESVLTLLRRYAPGAYSQVYKNIQGYRDRFEQGAVVDDIARNFQALEFVPQDKRWPYNADALLYLLYRSPAQLNTLLQACTSLYGTTDILPELSLSTVSWLADHAQQVPALAQAFERLGVEATQRKIFDSVQCESLLRVGDQETKALQVMAQGLEQSFSVTWKKAFLGMLAGATPAQRARLLAIEPAVASDWQIHNQSEFFELTSVYAALRNAGLGEHALELVVTILEKQDISAVAALKGLDDFEGLHETAVKDFLKGPSRFANKIEIAILLSDWFRIKEQAESEVTAAPHMVITEALAGYNSRPQTGYAAMRRIVASEATRCKIQLLEHIARTAIPPALAGDQVLLDKLSVIISLYYGIAKSRTSDCDKMQTMLGEAMKQYFDSGLNEQALEKWILGLPENQKEIRRLTSAKVGYDPRLWQEGIVVSGRVKKGLSAEEKQQQLSWYGYTVADAAKDMGIISPEEMAQVKLAGFQDADRFFREVVQARKQEALRTMSEKEYDLQQEHILNLLNQMRNLEETRVVASDALADQEVTIVIRKAFLSEVSIGGERFSACFNAYTGAARYMPVQHALEAGAFIALAYDAQGRQLANAVLALSDQGVLVFGDYRRGTLALDALWFEAWKQLTAMAPGVILSQSSAGRLAAEKLALEVPHQVALAKRPTLWKDPYFDSGEVDDKGRASFNIPKAVRVTHALLDRAGAFQAVVPAPQTNVQVQSVTDDTGGALAAHKARQQMVRDTLLGMKLVHLELGPFLRMDADVLAQMSEQAIAQGVLEKLKLKPRAPPKDDLAVAQDAQNRQRLLTQGAQQVTAALIDLKRRLNGGLPHVPGEQHGLQAAIPFGLLGQLALASLGDVWSQLTAYPALAMAASLLALPFMLGMVQYGGGALSFPGAADEAAAIGKMLQEIPPAQRQETGYALFLLSKLHNIFQQCLDKNDPESAGRIVVAALNNKMPGMAWGNVKTYAQMCLDIERPGLTAEICVAALSRQIAGIDAGGILDLIRQCFKKGWPGAAAQIIIAALNNKMPGMEASEVKTYIQQCLDQGYPDLAAEITITSLRNRLQGVTADDLKTYIQQCLNQGKPDAASRLGIAALTSKIPGIEASDLQDYIQQCFDRGWTVWAANLVIAALENKVSGIRTSDIQNYMQRCFDKDSHDSAAQIAVAAFASHLPGIESIEVKPYIQRCFDDGWPSSAAQIAVAALMNRIPGIDAADVQVYVRQCFLQRWPDRGVQIGIAALAVHLPGIKPEEVKEFIRQRSGQEYPETLAGTITLAVANGMPAAGILDINDWIRQCFDKGRVDLAYEIIVAALAGRVPGVDAVATQGYIRQCLDKNRPDRAVEIAIFACAHHVPGISADDIKAHIPQCLDKYGPDHSVEVIVKAFAGAIPDMEASDIKSYIQQCFEKKSSDAASRIISAALTRKASCIGADDIKSYIQQCIDRGSLESAARIAIAAFSAHESAVAQNRLPGFDGQLYFVLRSYAEHAHLPFFMISGVTGYALEHNKLTEVKKALRLLSAHRFMAPFLIELLAQEGELATQEALLSPAGIMRIGRLNRSIHAHLFSMLLPAAVDISNTRTRALLRSLVRYSTSTFSQDYRGSMEELYLQYRDAYKAGMIAALPRGLRRHWSIEVATTKNRAVSQTTQEYYRLLKQSADEALEYIKLREGLQIPVYGHALTILEKVIQDEIDALTARDGAQLPESAGKFIRMKKGLLIQARDKLVAADKDSFPLLALDASQLEAVGSLKGASFPLRIMLFTNAFMQNAQWREFFQTRAPAQATEATLGPLVEIIDSYIKPHLLEGVDTARSRLLLAPMSSATFKKEKERLGQEETAFRRRIGVYLTRGWIAEFIGSIADECWTRSSDIMRDNPGMMALVFVDEETSELLGGTLLVPAKIKGRPVLVDRGLSPRTQVTAALNVAEFVEKITGIEEEIGRTLKATQLLVPLRKLEAGLGSNNPDVIQYYERTVGTHTPVTLDAPSVFNNHDITSGKCVVLQDIAPAPAAGVLALGVLGLLPFLGQVFPWGSIAQLALAVPLFALPFMVGMVTGNGANERRVSSEAGAYSFALIRLMLKDSYIPGTRQKFRFKGGDDVLQETMFGYEKLAHLTRTDTGEVIARCLFREEKMGNAVQLREFYVAAGYPRQELAQQLLAYVCVLAGSHGASVQAREDEFTYQGSREGTRAFLAGQGFEAAQESFDRQLPAGDRNEPRTVYTLNHARQWAMKDGLLADTSRAPGYSRGISGFAGAFFFGAASLLHDPSMALVLVAAVAVLGMVREQAKDRSSARIIDPQEADALIRGKYQDHYAGSPEVPHIEATFAKDEGPVRISVGAAGQVIPETAAQFCNYIILWDKSAGRAAVIHASSASSPSYAAEILTAALNYMGIDRSRGGLIALVVKPQGPLQLLSDQIDLNYSQALDAIGITRLATESHAAWGNRAEVRFLVDEGMFVALDQSGESVARAVSLAPAALAPTLHEWSMDLLRRAGIIDIEIGPTDLGFYTPTPAENLSELSEVIGTHAPEKGLFLDVGSGRGLLSLCMAHAHPGLRVVGIEADGGLLRDSIKLRQEAAKQDASLLERVSFEQGDFNGPAFAGYFRDADVLYYYNWGTRDVPALAANLRRNVKVGARVVFLFRPDDVALKELVASGDFAYLTARPGITVLVRTGTHEETVSQGPRIVEGQEKVRIVESLPGKNWYYRTATGQERQRLTTRIFEGLHKETPAYIIKLVKRQLQKNGIDPANVTVRAILVYGSWCYSGMMKPSDIDITVVADGIGENIFLEGVPISNPDAWFKDASRGVAQCDLNILSSALIAQGTTGMLQAQLEAKQWGHSVTIYGKEFFTLAPSNEALMRVAQEFAMETSIRSIATNNRKPKVRDNNLRKIARRLDEITRIIALIRERGSLSPALCARIDAQAQAIRDALRRKNMEGVQNALSLFSQQLLKPPAQVAEDTAAVAAPGGIDFRALPILVRPSLGQGAVRMPQGAWHKGDAQWQEISRMLAAGITPSSQRLREYLLFCCQQGGSAQGIDKVRGCIADIMRMEEDTCCASEPALKDMLVVLESDKTTPELRKALLGSVSLEKEPALSSVE